jgi:hypothetical protein
MKVNGQVFFETVRNYHLVHRVKPEALKARIIA